MTRESTSFRNRYQGAASQKSISKTTSTEHSTHDVHTETPVLIGTKKHKYSLRALVERILLLFAFLKTAFSKYSLETVPFLFTPAEFRFPPALQYELAKFSLGDEKKTRAVFLIGICVALFVTDAAVVTSSTLSEGMRFHVYFILTPTLFLSSSFILVMGCLFRRNALYQNILTAASVALVWIVTVLYGLMEEGERIFTIVCFTCSLMTMIPLQYLKVYLICFVLSTIEIQVFREKYHSVVLQYALCAVSISFCAFCLTYFNQLQYRRTFLSQYFMNKRNQEAKDLADRLDSLLLNILPESIVEELSHKLLEDDDGTLSESDASSESGNHISALHMSYDASTVMFVKILDFSDMIMPLNATEIVQLLTEVYMEMDKIVEETGLYRIKTIQNNYLAVSGVPDVSSKHLKMAINAATKILKSMREKEISVIGRPVDISIGLASGPLVAGVIGITSYCYDIYGNTVNFSSRMCSTNTVRNSIQLPEEVFLQLDESISSRFSCIDEPVEVTAKGFGNVQVRHISLRINNLNPSVSLHSLSNGDTEYGSDVKRTRRDRHRRSKLALVQFVTDLKEKQKESAYDWSEVDKYERIHAHETEIPLDQIANAIPDKFVDFERKGSLPSLSYFWPVIACFRWHRLNMLFAKHTYRKFVNSNRVIFLVGFLIQLVTVANDFINLSLDGNDDKKNFIYSIRYSETQCRDMTWDQILITKIGVAGFIFLITQLPVFTPLYSLHFVLFQGFSMIASLGGIVAISVGLGAVCSDLFGQFYLLCYILLVFSLQGVHPHIKTVPFLSASLCYAMVVILPPFEMGMSSLVVIPTITNLIIFLSIVSITMYATVIAEGQSRNDFFFRGVGEKKRAVMERRTKKVFDILKSIFPSEVIEQAQMLGSDQSVMAQYVESMSISYADICGFSKWSSTKSAKRLVNILSNLFSQFDIIAERHKVYRLQLVGDNYVSISGCPVPDKNHHANIVRFALEANRFVHQAYRDISFRFGVHSGYAVAGILQTLKQQYCVFGTTTTIGELMEQTGVPGRVHISANVHHHLEKNGFTEFSFETRKQKIENDILEQPMQTYFVEWSQESQKENFGVVPSRARMQPSQNGELRDEEQGNTDTPLHETEAEEIRVHHSASTGDD
mmetsp:Transcript_5949/g.22580  ORF Transcript_5949/g.22580 Transcript_5949/m.22580 type:complete len:1130 (-) Transcript_5949:2605-5994(-)